MLSVIYEYSGILMVAVVWLMIIIPSTKAGLNYKKQPMSVTGTVPRYKNIFNTGLVISGFLLLLFAIFIDSFFGLPLVGVGTVILAVSAVILSLLGIITLKHSIRIHNNLTYLHYFLVSVGGLLISVGVYPVFSTWSVFGVILIFTGSAGIIYFHYYKKWIAYSQYWSVVFSSLWVLSFYLLLI